MPIDLDFSDAQSESLPDGMYVVRVSEAEVGESKNGNPTLYLTFDVIQPEDFAGRKLWDSPSLLKQAMWKVKNIVEAITREEFPFEAGISLDENDLIGQFVRVSTYTDNYNGQNRAKIKDYFPDE